MTTGGRPPAAERDAEREARRLRRAAAAASREAGSPAGFAAPPGVDVSAAPLEARSAVAASEAAPARDTSDVMSDVQSDVRCGVTRSRSEIMSPEVRSTRALLIL